MTHSIENYGIMTVLIVVHWPYVWHKKPANFCATAKPNYFGELSIGYLFESPQDMYKWEKDVCKLS